MGASLNRYGSGMSERMLTISSFAGVDQSYGDHHPDPSTSPDSKNFISRYGELRTTNGITAYGAALPTGDETDAIPIHPRIFQAFLNGGITKIVSIYKRNVYAMNSDGSWTKIGEVDGDEYDSVNYRHEEDEWFLITDGEGKLYKWDGTQTISRIFVTQGVDIIDENDERYNISEVDEETGEHYTPHEIYFQQLALLYERLWGAVTTESPDRVFWSKTFDPTDWELDYEIEDDGGGFVDVSTFDGSKVRAVVAAFDNVMIFKDKTVHVLNGTYPGEFSLHSAYGTQGCIAIRTIVYNGTYLLFLSSDGLCRYDGMTVTTMLDLGDRKLKGIWSRLNHQAIERSCAVIYKGVMYLSIPLDDDERNTCVVEYSISEGTYNIIDIPNVDDFLVYRNGQTETLLMISGNQMYTYDDGASIYNEPIEAYWTTPEISLGSLASKKSTGRIYMAVYATQVDIRSELCLKITMSSGNKVRSKIIPLNPGINYLRKRVKIRGRIFRMKLENQNGCLLSLPKGVEIHIEDDAD